MRRRARGSLEQQVLETVAAAPAPQSVAQVAAAVPGDAAYTTVMTTLTRLCDKGALHRDKQGRGFVYSLAADLRSVAAARTARQMHRLLAEQGERADVLARFVAELEPNEEQMLLELLADDERGRTVRPGD
ncbi:putative transcriptional regulator [Nocardia sp. GAS34]|uniref:BlaI/MecI/CopY family transcriptional regulator n=1 Tax=unclassified Nocardia TaxID=2637762 RepID=UPI003D1C3E1F